MTLHIETWQTVAITAGFLGVATCIVSVALFGFSHSGLKEHEYWGPHRRKFVAAFIVGVLAFWTGIELFNRAPELARMQVRVEEVKP